MNHSQTSCVFGTFLNITIRQLPEERREHCPFPRLLLSPGASPRRDQRGIKLHGSRSASRRSHKSKSTHRCRPFTAFSTRRSRSPRTNWTRCRPMSISSSWSSTMPCTMRQTETRTCSLPMLGTLRPMIITLRPVEKIAHDLISFLLMLTLIPCRILFPLFCSAQACELCHVASSTD